jgi:mannosyl-oligosaccharide alpha-1,2-mannosidase
MTDIEVISHVPQEGVNGFGRSEGRAGDEDDKYNKPTRAPPGRATTSSRSGGTSSGGALRILLLLLLCGVTGFSAFLFADIRALTRVQKVSQDLQRVMEAQQLLRNEVAHGAEPADDLEEKQNKILSKMNGFESKTSAKVSELKEQLSALQAEVVKLKDELKAETSKRESIEKAISGQSELKKKLEEITQMDLKTKLEQVEASLVELRKSVAAVAATGQGHAGGAPARRQQTPQFNTENEESPNEVAWANREMAEQEAARQRLELEEAQQVRLQQENADRAAREQDQLRSFQAHAAGGTISSVKPKLTDETAALDSDAKVASRRDAVRAAFKDGWTTYKRHAWGHDEVKPNSKQYYDWTYRSHGLGLTILDSLDTLLLMNLTHEFVEALDWVENKLDFNQPIKVSAFECTIRVVGGLLSAYELHGEQDRVLLQRAEEIMNKLLYAYNTSSGIPHQTVNLKQLTHWSPEWTGGAAVLSEFASVQLELRTLSYHTKNPIYDIKATHLMSIVKAKCATENYLCPTSIDTNQVVFRDDHYTFGALGDSYYEYLLKQWLLTGKTEGEYKEMAVKALDAAITKLVRYSEPSRFTYLAEYVNGGLDHKMDELACFAGGMFALASQEIPDSGFQKTFLKVGEGLTKTCYEMFRKTNTGLAPESVEFRQGADFASNQEYYLLRPETSESLFYLWRITKDEKYREWQWDIFLHLKEYCHVPSGGFAGLRGVNIIPPEQDDQQQSYLLAETFKYMYLTFADDVLPLNEWVFNTEAHPLKIRKRNPMDIWTQWERDHHGELPWYPPWIDGVQEVQTERMRGMGDIQRVAPQDPLSIDEPPDEDGIQREQDEANNLQRRNSGDFNMAQSPSKAVKTAAAERIAREKAAERVKANQLADEARRAAAEKDAADEAERDIERQRQEFLQEQNKLAEDGAPVVDGNGNIISPQVSQAGQPGEGEPMPRNQDPAAIGADGTSMAGNTNPPIESDNSTPSPSSDESNPSQGAPSTPDPGSQPTTADDASSAQAPVASSGSGSAPAGDSEPSSGDPASNAASSPMESAPGSSSSSLAQ